MSAKPAAWRSRLPARSSDRQAHPALVIAARLVVGAIAIWLLISVLGLILTHVFNTGPVHSADLGADKWFERRRSAGWDSLMLFGTSMAVTLTVVIATAVLAAAMRWLLGHWRASLVLITSVVGEVVIFLAVTLTVPQRRPPVPKLQAVPPTSSYPSGHTAASVALYCCLAVLLLICYGRHPLARILAALLFLVPVFVGVARVYMGEHYPSDVIAGALLGTLWLVHVLRTLPGDLAPARRSDHAPGNRGRRRLASASRS